MDDLHDHLAGVTDFTTSTPTARSRRSTKARPRRGRRRLAAPADLATPSTSAAVNAPRREPVENAGQFVGQAFEHRTTPVNVKRLTIKRQRRPGRAVGR
jgi:hypothetical protein